LHGKASETQPSIGSANIGGIGREYLIGECTERVSYQEFASDSARKPKEAFDNVA